MNHVKILKEVGIKDIGEHPYSNDAPVLISYDHDMGWIIESVFDGEYEVQNLPFHETKNEDIDWDLVADLSQNREVILIKQK